MADVSHPDADGLVGSVTIWPSDILPGAKYRFCEGETISRTEFSLCFARIGTAHGVGDGSATFNLPNYTGKMLVGLDDADNDFDTVGDTGGVKAATMPAHGHTMSGAPGVGSLATSNTGAHTHNITVSTNVASAEGHQTPVSATQIVFQSRATDSQGNHTHAMSGAPSVGTLAVANAGGGGNNMPPFTTVRYVIKVA